MKRLSIVVPVNNEEKTLKQVIGRILATKLDGWEKEVIVVNDGSTDQTSSILAGYKDTVKIVSREYNGGKGAALKDGFKAATGDYILIQDADLEYNPEDYKTLLLPIEQGKAETVFGSRKLGHNTVSSNKFYYYGGLILSRFFNFFFRTSLTDIATCYKVFPRRMIELLVKPSPNDFAFDVVTLSYLLARNTKVVEVPIQYAPRVKEEGKKLNWRHAFSCVTAVVTLWVKEKTPIVKDCFEKRSWLRTLLVFCAFFLTFLWMYFSVTTVATSDDHFFHFRFAQLMLQRGFFASFWNFKSLYFSKMSSNQYFVYYNFIFYLVLIPFTFIQPLFLAIKLYAVFAAALGFTTLYWCAKKFHVKYAFCWTAVIFAITNSGSIWRFFSSRPFTLAPAMMLLLLYFLYRKNRVGAFILSFLYLYWHCSTFFFPLIVACSYFLFQALYEGEADWLTLLSVTGGTVASVAFSYVISPGFLLFVKDTEIGIYFQTIIGKQIPLPEGGELYPSNFFDFLQANTIIVSALIVGVVVEIKKYLSFRSYRMSHPAEKKNDPEVKAAVIRATLFFLSIGFFAGTIIISQRFGDFFVFFAGLYLILAFSAILQDVKIGIVRQGIVVGLTIVIVYLCISNVLLIQNEIATAGVAPDLFSQVGGWLNQNTKPGDIIFNASWNWFPQLYYYSPNDNYIIGLEPRFMYVYNPSLYWEWWHITSDGYDCNVQNCPDLDAEEQQAFLSTSTQKVWAAIEGNQTAATILNDFHSSYVVTADSPYGNFDFLLDNNTHFKKVFADPHGYEIYKVSP